MYYVTTLLLTNFLHEIYEYSNFSMYNKREIVECKKESLIMAILPI